MKLLRRGTTPGVGTGAVSMLVLAVALIALYAKHLVGSWRWIVVAAVSALYFNVLVLIVQSFQKVPTAPTQSEPPFLIAQGVALTAFLFLDIAAAFRLRPAPAIAAY